MQKKLHYLLTYFVIALSSTAHAASLGEATATIDWSSFRLTVLSGTTIPTLGVEVPPTFDYASVDSSVGSDSVLAPLGFGAGATVSNAELSGNAAIDPFDAGGIESLPSGTPSGSIIASSSITSAASGGEFVEIEANRTVRVTASDIVSVLFQVDYTLETALLAASAPIAQAIARVTLGTAVFPDGSSFILDGSTASLELLNVGFDASRTHNGTLAFIYDFGIDETIYLAANALTSLDNIPPAPAAVPLPASILFLLSAVPMFARLGQRHTG